MGLRVNPSLKKYVDDLVAAAIVTANAYTDAEVAAAIVTANAYTDSEITAAIAAHEGPSGNLWLEGYQEDLVDGVETTVLLDAIRAGFTDGIENVVTHRIQPGVDGFYSVMGMVSLYNCVADTDYKMLIQTVADVLAYCRMPSGTTDKLSLFASNVIYLTADEYVYLTITSYAGVNTVDLQDGYDSTFLAVQRVR